MLPFIDEMKDYKEYVPQTFISQILPCLNPRLILNSAELMHERDIVFGLTRVKKPPILSMVLDKIYKFLTDESTCDPIGNHWQKIGF
jgi:hypothetical protein